ncbi:MAG: alpha/beta fold hydrolase [Desulfobacterales bacterium]|uniref:Alpha/beta fold hydrolase n=1 Tax=Candidatus Desulfatibia vada TaxID=2841696 RepID=A0A8J6NRB2_9BACT|nr:alpha/beta fold hydrolase [Candidatus Desulfatibia vada]
MRFVKLCISLSIMFYLVLCPTARAAESTGIELVQLTTADGVKLTGVVRRPSSSRYQAGIVLIHGYSGNFYSSVMQFLPEALTDSGFCTLAVNMRDHDRVPKKNLFEENRHDIAAAVDEMQRRGYSPIFLYGHSMGTNRVLYYQAATEDPRIAGMILTGPPGNLYEWNVRIFGQDAAAQLLRRAQELKTAGKGNEWMLINLGPLGKTLYTADHLVSLRGPETFSDPYKNIGRISLPVLIVHGLADRLADPVVADRLSSHAGAGSKVKVVKIAGAGHGFHGHQQNLVDQVHNWLLEKLPPKP